MCLLFVRGAGLHSRSQTQEKWRELLRYGTLRFRLVCCGVVNVHFTSNKMKKKKSLQHPVFPSGHPSKY